MPHLHHPSLRPDKLDPVDYDVHQALEVHRVQARVYPIGFPPRVFDDGFRSAGPGEV